MGQRDNLTPLCEELVADQFALEGFSIEEARLLLNEIMRGARFNDRTLNPEQNVVRNSTLLMTLVDMIRIGTHPKRYPSPLLPGYMNLFNLLYVVAIALLGQHSTLREAWVALAVAVFALLLAFGGWKSASEQRTKVASMLPEHVQKAAQS